MNAKNRLYAVVAQFMVIAERSRMAASDMLLTADFMTESEAEKALESFKAEHLIDANDRVTTSSAAAVINVNTSGGKA